ncbi:ABC transporter substrate-binding protein [Chloroflexota bacterium]
MFKTTTRATLRRIRPGFICIMTISLLLIALPGCTDEGTELSHLKVVTLPYIGYSTLFIAQEEGYFTEQGLDVEFVKFPTSTQAIPLLAQGDLDVVVGSVSGSTINAIAQDLNMKIVAGGTYCSPDCEVQSLMVRKDLYESGELDTVAELKGRRIATNCVACVSDFAMTIIFETGNLTLDDVTTDRMRPPDMIAAFENKAIEAAMVGNPQVEQIKSLGYAVSLESSSYLMPGFELMNVIFGPSLLDNNPELGEKFMVAYLKGARQYNQGKTERNLEIMLQYTGLDRELLLKNCLSPARSDGEIETDNLIAFQEWAHENGYIDAIIPLDQLVDTRFADHAIEELGPAS